MPKVPQLTHVKDRIEPRSCLAPTKNLFKYLVLILLHFLPKRLWNIGLYTGPKPGSTGFKIKKTRLLQVISYCFSKSGTQRQTGLNWTCEQRLLLRFISTMFSLIHFAFTTCST